MAMSKCHGKYLRALQTRIEREHAKVLPVLSKQIFEIERLRIEWDDGKATTVLSLLQDFSSRKATDDRDKVFALLGLARDIKTIQPNYLLGTVEVYRRTAIHLIKHSGSLTALSGDMKRKNSGGIPSWIPDWSVAMEEPDRRRMQLAGTYKTFPRWRIVLIDREFEYWETVTTDMNSLYEEIESGKRRPIPRDIVDGLISYERVLTRIHGSASMDIGSLDPPKERAIHECKRLYKKFKRVLDIWLKKVQYLETERCKTKYLLISDQEKEETVVKTCEHPTIETITSKSAAPNWFMDTHMAFYTMTGHIRNTFFAEICRSRSITHQTLWSLTLEATDAVHKDRNLDVYMTFDSGQGTPVNGGLLNQLSHLMRLASGVLSLWTQPGAFQEVQRAKDACRGLINLHRNKNLSTTYDDYAAIFSKAVVFMDSATWMRHLRDNGEPKVSLYNEHFLKFRSEKQHEVFGESKAAFHISSKFIATVGQCTERLLT
ncbi:heterokaryon incompatibility (het-6OR allele) [Fusarium agapanthi]|uniref:Heterokaryon incompatibility (Het-6OR allele) n=1 Tax=Fusarium agapanthi TaxID=1803897 RepID=A0A9P5BG84_9HYPO|nr:heterokaryon incompatibility (het-6OR allele) [Fusarium agapanthi]